jgi:hypothetical protein
MGSEKMDNQKKTLFIFCLLTIMFCLACLHAASKTDQGDNAEKGSIEVQDTNADDRKDRLIIVSSEGEDQEHEDEPLLPAESAEKNVQELPCEDDTVNAELNPDQEDTAQKALQAYGEFLAGRRKACGMDILYLATPTGEPDRRRTTEYVILDSNGDGIPELHTRTGREFYAFTYRNGQMEILAGFFSHPVQYTLLTDGAFIYREDRGVTCGSCYCKFRLDSNGEEIDKTKFWWIDTNENLIMDENDEYVYNNMECTKEEWLSRTANDIYVDDEGREHYCSEVEWFTYCEAI